MDAGLLKILQEPGGRAPKTVSKNPVSELDTEHNVARAVRYLQHEADPAIENRGGDPTTYVTACRVRGLGLSADRAYLEMVEHYNPRCIPPWDAEGLRKKVDSAYRSATGVWGGDTAEADFEPVNIEILEPEKKTTARSPLVLHRFDRSETCDIPPRRWLYGRKLLAKYVAFCASPGGVGKTSWALTMALACASGMRLLHDQPHHPMNVWYYNLEDDLDEMHRRLDAAARFYDLPKEVTRRVALSTGRERGLQVLGLRNDQFVVQPDAGLVTERIQEDRIELSIIDPFLRSHGVKENDNEAQDEVMRVYADIADKTDSCFLLLHHTKKGAVSGDADSLRGGSTQGGSARTVLTMTGMSKDEAKAMGLDEHTRRHLVRIDDAKRNMAPPAGDAEWIRLNPVRLGNCTEDYPDGDEVQAASVWSPPSPSEGLDEARVEETLAAIEAGTDDGERYSARPQDKDRWAGSLVADMLHKSENEAGVLLKEWIARGVLEVRAYKSPAQRRTRQGVFRADCVSENQ